MKQKKKIAIVTNSTWNVFNFRLNLVRKLKAEGFEVIVIAPLDEYISYLNKASLVKHIPLKSLDRKSTNPIKDGFLFLEFMRIFRKEKPDLIIHYTIKPNIYGGLAAYFSGKKFMGVVTGLGYTFLNDGFIKKMVDQLYRWSFGRAEKVLFENNDDRRLFIDHKIADHKKCITVNGCGVNLHHFKPGNTPKQDEEKRIFLFVGRLLYDKGIVEFVEAAKHVKEKCPTAEFWVIGELDTNNPSTIRKDQLLEWIEAKTIIYHGTTKDIRKFFRKVSVVVLPSYREGLPKVILEAMAMALPIITTDTAGCRETIMDDEPSNGLLVPLKNIEKLAAAIEKMSNMDYDKLREMGQKGRKFVSRKYSDQVVTSQFMEIIEEVLEKDK